MNEAEAETIRALYQLYLELGSVRALKQEADRRGWVTKRQFQQNGTVRGGRPFSRGNLYQILHNPIYAGDIAHRGRTYPGLHEAIVDRALWDAVQRMLDGKAPDRKSATNVRGASVLAGKVFDDTGDRLAPTSCAKDGKRHRYYVSSRLLKGGARGGSGWRLPARKLEQAVAQGMAQKLSDPITMTGHFPTLSPHDVQPLVRGAAELASCLRGGDLPKIYELLSTLLHRIVLGPESMRIEVKAGELLRRALGHDVNGADHDHVMVIDLPTELRRRGVEFQAGAAGEWTQRARPKADRARRAVAPLARPAHVRRREVGPRDRRDRPDRRDRREPVPPARLPRPRHRRGHRHGAAGRGIDGGHTQANKSGFVGLEPSTS